MRTLSERHRTQMRAAAVVDGVEAVPGPAARDPIDGYPVDEVLSLLPGLPGWPTSGHEANERLRGARRVLDWLAGFPGDGWQDRWLMAQADDGAWIGKLVADDPRGPKYSRYEVLSGLCSLLLVRLVRPSYGFLADYHARTLFDRVRQTLCPDRFAEVQHTATSLGMNGRQTSSALVVLSKMLLHTGKTLDHLTGEDFFQARADILWSQGRKALGLHTAWELLRAMRILPGERNLHAALREGQRPTVELVDRYNLRCKTIRDVIVRYCEERRPGLDYASFRHLVGDLAGNFWADLEAHHPGIDSLHLSSDMALGWKERMRFVTDRRFKGRERTNRAALFLRIRAFYLDIRQWALEEPSWAPFAVPCPITKRDTEGQAKDRQRVSAAIHQRIRERLPLLPLLVDTAERNRDRQLSLLDAAAATPIGATFEHEGTTYQRTEPKSRSRSSHHHGPPHIFAKETPSGEPQNLTRAENSAFWAWAIIETLRHTGVRVEELLEITHLALTTYQIPDTGEIVPLLQIVPSKSNSERLLPID